MKFTIEHLEETGSTNTLLKERAAQGAPEGLVLAAEFQTGGRGKPGNKWLSPRGKNLLFSVLLRPPMTPAQAPILTQTACRSIAKVLKDRYDIDSEYKKPNDILVGGRKICGTLVEAVSDSGGVLKDVIVGVGLNVNASREDLIEGATSMKAVRNKDFDRNLLLNNILDQLEKDIAEYYAPAA